MKPLRFIFALALLSTVAPLRLALAQFPDDAPEALLCDAGTPIPEDADFATIYNNASSLLRRLDRFTSGEPAYLLTAIVGLQKIDSENDARNQRENDAAWNQLEKDALAFVFYDKFAPIYEPRLQKAAYDESILPGDARKAFFTLVDILNRRTKSDELVALRENELAREATAREAKDDDALFECDKRLANIDLYVFADFLALDANPLEDDVRRRAQTLVKELDRDPRILPTCDAFFKNVSRRIALNPDIAYDFRADVVARVDRDAAKRLLENQTGNPFAIDAFSVYDEPPTFNESLFDIPDGKSQEFYRERASELHRELQRLRVGVHRAATYEEYQKRVEAINAVLLIRGQLQQPFASSSLNASQQLLNAPLTPETEKFLRQTLDKEINKPFGQANSNFIRIARAALSRYELLRALNEEDEDAVRNACDRILERAIKSKTTAELVPDLAKQVADRYPEIALNLMNRLVDSIDLSTNQSFSLKCFETINFIKDSRP